MLYCKLIDRVHQFITYKTAMCLCYNFYQCLINMSFFISDVLQCQVCMCQNIILSDVGKRTRHAHISSEISENSHKFCCGHFSKNILSVIYIVIV